MTHKKAQEKTVPLSSAGGPKSINQKKKKWSVSQEVDSELWTVLYYVKVFEYCWIHY